MVALQNHQALMLSNATIREYALLAFSIVAYFHRKVERSITRHKIWQQIKATHVARIKLDWANIPSISSKSPVTDHPFETDLDITGERSLHQLITTAISYEGRQ